MIKINRHTVAFKTSTVMLSKIISATISLVFVPIYIKLLGVESYGLVAFYLLLMGVLVVVDLALSTALSRQQ
jgi:O-antigen/teichoic acid export membrane protein